MQGGGVDSSAFDGSGYGSYGHSELDTSRSQESRELPSNFNLEKDDDIGQREVQPERGGVLKSLKKGAGSALGKLVSAVKSTNPLITAGIAIAVVTAAVALGCALLAGPSAIIIGATMLMFGGVVLASIGVTWDLFFSENTNLQEQSQLDQAASDPATRGQPTPGGLQPEGTRDSPTVDPLADNSQHTSVNRSEGGQPAAGSSYRRPAGPSSNPAQRPPQDPPSSSYRNPPTSGFNQNMGPGGPNPYRHAGGGVAPMTPPRSTSPSAMQRLNQAGPPFTQRAFSDVANISSTYSPSSPGRGVDVQNLSDDDAGWERDLFDDDDDF